MASNSKDSLAMDTPEIMNPAGHAEVDRGSTLECFNNMHSGGGRDGLLKFREGDRRRARRAMSATRFHDRLARVFRGRY